MMRLVSMQTQKVLQDLKPGCAGLFQDGIARPSRSRAPLPQQHFDIARAPLPWD